MKRRRKWWLWLLIALACMIIAFAIAELTGASIIGTFGWGILGILGAVGIMAALVIGAVFFIVPVTGGIWLLLRHLISNREILYVTLGGLGLCAILVGWILTARHSGWSLPVMMIGFGLGCFTGVEYQKHLSIDSNEYAKEIEQIHSEEKGEG